MFICPENVDNRRIILLLLGKKAIRRCPPPYQTVLSWLGGRGDREDRQHWRWRPGAARRAGLPGHVRGRKISAALVRSSLLSPTITTDRPPTGVHVLVRPLLPLHRPTSFLNTHYIPHLALPAPNGAFARTARNWALPSQHARPVAHAAWAIHRRPQPSTISRQPSFPNTASQPVSRSAAPRTRRRGTSRDASTWRVDVMRKRGQDERYAGSLRAPSGITSRAREY